MIHLNARHQVNARKANVITVIDSHDTALLFRSFGFVIWLIPLCQTYHKKYRGEGNGIIHPFGSDAGLVRERAPAVLLLINKHLV